MPHAAPLPLFHAKSKQSKQSTQRWQGNSESCRGRVRRCAKIWAATYPGVRMPFLRLAAPRPHKKNKTGPARAASLQMHANTQYGLLVQLGGWACAAALRHCPAAHRHASHNATSPDPDAEGWVIGVPVLCGHESLYCQCTHPGRRSWPLCARCVTVMQYSRGNQREKAELPGINAELNR